MPVDERSRYELHLRLEATIGADGAATLMAHLPPVGWADAATKGDLAALEERMFLRFAVIDERIEKAKNEVVAAVRGELVAAVAGQTRTMVLALIGSMLTSGSLVLAATKLG